MRVKSESEIKKNYEDATTLVPGRYEAGVRGAEWQAPSVAGQALYVAQMSSPDILARREKGIRTISDAQWQSDAITKGKGIIGARMKAASDKQVSGFAPYRAVLESITLPPRSADGMTNLMNRAGPIVSALENKKKAM